MLNYIDAQYNEEGATFFV